MEYLNFRWSYKSLMFFILLIFFYFKSPIYFGQSPLFYMSLNADKDTIITEGRSYMIYSKRVGDRYFYYERSNTNADALVHFFGSFEIRCRDWGVEKIHLYSEKSGRYKYWKFRSPKDTINSMLLSESNTYDTKLELVEEIEYDDETGRISAIKARRFMPLEGEMKYWYYDEIIHYDRDGNIFFERRIDENGDGFEMRILNDDRIDYFIRFEGYEPITLIGDNKPFRMGPYYSRALSEYYNTGKWELGND